MKKKQRMISTCVVVPRILATGEIEVLLQLKREYQEWEFPGGKLDSIETTAQCAIRELYEETNIMIEELEFVTYVDHGNKFCCLIFVARKWIGEPRVAEPHKHSAIGWFPINDLPKPITKATAKAIAAGAFKPLKECEDATTL